MSTVLQLNFFESEKSPNIQKLSFKIPLIEEEITREIRLYFELDVNKNIIYQNLWNANKTAITLEGNG